VQATRLVAKNVTVSMKAELAAANVVDGPLTLEMVLEPTGIEGPKSIEAIIGFQTCSDSTCDPPWATKLTATLPGDSAAEGRLAFAEARYAEAARAVAAIEVGAGGQRRDDAHRDAIVVSTCGRRQAVACRSRCPPRSSPAFSAG